MVGVGFFSLFLFGFLLLYPHSLLSSMNWFIANPLLSPIQIEPEWYFLPYYSLLRACSNKNLGIILLVSVLAGLLSLPFMRMNELVAMTVKGWWFGVFSLNLSTFGSSSFLSLLILANFPIEQPFLSFCRFDFWGLWVGF